MEQKYKQKSEQKNKSFLPDNISHFNGCEILAELKKARSPLSIKFMSVKDDDFLIHLVEYHARTGIVTHYAQITRNDLMQRISSYTKDAFTMID